MKQPFPSPQSQITEAETESSVPLSQGSSPARWGLCIAWCCSEPWRVGEVAPLVDSTEAVVGRDRRALRFGPLRAGRYEPGAPLASPRLSRRQLTVTLRDETLRITNVGRAALCVDGQTVEFSDARVGSVIECGRQLVLVVVHLPDACPKISSHEFGRADVHGWVGESRASFQLRREIQFCQQQEQEHVLILGRSGSGKELVAHAIAQGARRLVSRNAATIPPGLVDAELFGNIKNYPNASMPERSGLVGEAHEGVLFLDEVGELPAEQQAHLLRVLDCGEYTRLGDPKARQSQFRMIAATNRSKGALKPDFAARLRLEVTVPDLNERKSDIPLLARHILENAARGGSPMAQRMVSRTPDGRSFAHLSNRLVVQLLKHDYLTNFRELEHLLLVAQQQALPDAVVLNAITTRGGRTTLTPSSTSSPDLSEALDSPSSPSRLPPRPGELTPVDIQDALDRNNGVLEKTWQELGLSSRYALGRLIKKHDLEVRRRAKK